MLSLTILSNIASIANAYHDEGFGMRSPSWSVTGAPPVIKSPSSYRLCSEGGADAWMPGALDQKNHKIQDGFNLGPGSKFGQNRAINFDSYSKKNFPDLVGEDWTREDWMNADEDLYQQLLQPHLDYCAEDCWMKDDCAQAYAFLRMHNDGDGVTNVVQGYQDLVDSQAESMHGKLIFYCHHFNVNKNEAWPVYQTENGAWQSGYEDDEFHDRSVDGNNYVSLVYTRKNFESCGFMPDYCPYSEAIDKFLIPSEGDPRDFVMSDARVGSFTSRGGLNAEYTTIMGQGTMSYLKSICAQLEDCMGVELTFRNTFDGDGERIYSAEFYKFSSDPEVFRESINWYHANSASSEDEFGRDFEYGEGGVGYFFKMARCRPFNEPHFNAILSSPSFIVPLAMEEENDL